MAVQEVGEAVGVVPVEEMVEVALILQVSLAPRVGNGRRC